MLYFFYFLFLNGKFALSHKCSPVHIFFHQTPKLNFSAFLILQLEVANLVFIADEYHLNILNTGKN